MRRTRQIVTRQQQLLDIICDGCGESCRGSRVFQENPASPGELDQEQFEMATIVAKFSEGDAAGDRFRLEICQKCFFDLLEWFLLDKKGILDYHNIVDQEQSADLDELRLYFAHRRSGTLPEDSYAECEDS